MNLTPSDGFPYYISLVADNDYLALFQSPQTFRILESVSEGKSTYRYDKGKWSIKQILGHMTDHERIMIYRALRFSRNDDTTLSGYDQNTLVENSFFDHVSFATLLNDFKNVRSSTLSFISTLSDEQFQRRGKAWKFEISVLDILKATIGHEIHHIKILKERYGV